MFHSPAVVSPIFGANTRANVARNGLLYMNSIAGFPAHLELLCTLLLRLDGRALSAHVLAHEPLPQSNLRDPMPIAWQCDVALCWGALGRSDVVRGTLRRINGGRAGRGDRHQSLGLPAGGEPSASAECGSFPHRHRSVHCRCTPIPGPVPVAASLSGGLDSTDHV
jgi:hypothetical protein